jgi:2-C-methyl-D-erythritol 4-phosphate cytidylyltransferase
MGASVPKQFLDLGGKPILRHTIERFLSAAPGIRIVTVLPKEYVPYWKDYCLSNSFDCPQTLVQGGITRFHSVRNALGRVPGGCIVAIHDGVRPLLSADLVKNMFERMESGSCRALVPVVPTVDTLKVLDEKGVIVSTADRETIYRVQTPQVFRADLIKGALTEAMKRGLTITDDCSAMELMGIQTHTVEGDEDNLKLTTPRDFVLAEAILKNRGSE